MRRHRFLRLAVGILPALLVPALVACEEVLDFDRTPLQPIYEASAPPDSATEGGTKTTSSSSSSSGSSSSSSGSSTSSSSSSSGGQPQDAGSDADAGSS